MENCRYPKATEEMTEMRGKFAPEIEAASRQFSRAVSKEGALSRNKNRSIAVAESHVTQMPTGRALAHSALALQTLQDVDANTGSAPEL